MNSSPSTKAEMSDLQQQIPLEARRHPVVTAVSDALRQRITITPGTPVVVGVSGGADSLALLVAMTIIARRRDSADRLIAEPIACHVHHHLRSDDEADADAEHVAQVCQRLGVRCEVVHAEPAREPGNVEANARRLRYEAIVSVAHAASASNVATAHHADDQFETMLMALCRGAGPGGLAGMAWQRSVPFCDDGDVSLIRPMLAVAREDCASLCQAAGITWREDASNVDTTYARNRVRHDVIPVLESLWPGLADRAEHIADLMRVCGDLLEADLAERFGPAVSQSWPREDLRATDAALITAGLRRAILAALPDVADQLASRTLHEAAAAIRSGERHRKYFALPRGWVLQVDANEVRLTSQHEQEQQ